MRPQDNEIKKFINKNGDKVFSDLSVENYDEIQTLKTTKADKTEIPDTSNFATKGELEDTNLRIDVQESTLSTVITDIDTLKNTKQDKGDYATNSRVDSVVDSFDNDIETISTHIDDIYTNKADKSDTYTKQEVDDKVAHVTVDAYTKDETDSLLSGKQDVGDYATNNDLHSLDILKADKSDTYTKQEVDDKVAHVTVDAYTKDETDSLLNAKANQTSLNETNNNVDALTGEVENIAGELDSKADKSEIPTIPSNISYFNNDSGYVDNTYHDVTKQDVIQDLSTIRVNAQIGAGLSTQVGDNTSNIAYLDEKVREIELFKFPNAVIIGEPNISNGQVSGFSTSNYMQFPFILDLHNKAFQIDFAFTTGDNITTQQNILDSQFGLALAIQNGKGVMAISGNGTSWNIGSSTGTIPIQSNTTYYARLSWNGMQYRTLLSTNGIDYTQDMYLVGVQAPYPRTIYIGGCTTSETGHTPHPFLGTINMNKAFLTVNGQVIWQGMDDAGLATRADISLSNLDEIGQAKFDEKQDVIDDLDNIRTNATAGKSANDTIANYGNIVSHNADEFQVAGDYATNSKVTEVETTANNAKAIAEGKATGYVFDTKEAMDSWVQEHSSELKLGDNLYIRAVDVPDYWWDGSQAQQLETQKVDLTNYTTKTDLSNGLATKQDTISNLSTIESNASNGATAYTTIQSYGDIVTHNAIEFALKSEIPDVSKYALDSGVVHKAGVENISGVKTFTGGSGGNNVAIKAPNGMSIGSTTQTAYAQYATIRLVNNKVNTGSYYIDGNSSVLFRHKTGTATAEGTANDAMFTINPETGIKAGWSGTAGVGITDSDLHDVLIDTIEYSKLNTNAKDIIGAINEVKLNITLLEGAEQW